MNASFESSLAPINVGLVSHVPHVAIDGSCLSKFPRYVDGDLGHLFKILVITLEVEVQATVFSLLDKMFL